MVGDPATVVKYGTCPRNVAVSVPDPPLKLIAEPVGVAEMLNVPDVSLVTK